MAQLKKVTAHVEDAEGVEEAIRAAARAIGKSARTDTKIAVFGGPKTGLPEKAKRRVGKDIGPFTISADNSEPDKNFRVEFTRKG